MEDSPSQTELKYTAEEWDEIRLNFQTSIMVDTKLLSLGQNLDLTEWPIEGEDETPAKYIDYSMEELQELPGLAGHPERINLLVETLRDTLAFDDPFGDMVEQVESAAAREDGVAKTLNKLEITGHYPIRLTNLSQETKEFCEAEEIETLEQFAAFAQNMAQNVVVGGDFRSFLNCLSHVDEQRIAQFLPFRPRHSGLHLQEGVGLVIDRLEPAERLALLKKYGKKLTDAEEQERQGVSAENLAQIEQRLTSQARQFLEWFSNERDKLRSAEGSDQSLERYLMVLNDPDKERIAVQVLERALQQEAPKARKPAPGAAPPVSKPPKQQKEKKKGFFQRLFGG